MDKVNKNIYQNKHEILSVSGGDDDVGVKPTDEEDNSDIVDII